MQILLGDFNLKKSKLIGDKSLQNSIDGYISASQAKISHEEAQLKFIKEWDKIENEIKKQLKTI